MGFLRYIFEKGEMVMKINKQIAPSDLEQKMFEAVATEQNDSYAKKLTKLKTEKISLGLKVISSLAAVFIAALMITVFVLKDSNKVTASFTLPSLETEGFEVEEYSDASSAACQFYASNYEELYNASDLIVIVKPLENFENSRHYNESAYYNNFTARLCEVQSVIKGAVEGKTMYVRELATMKDGKIYKGYNYHIMCTGSSYLLFLNKYNTEDTPFAPFRNGIYCEYTAINDGFINDQEMYYAVMQNHNELFKGDDFRLGRLQTGDVFKTKYARYPRYVSAEFEYEGNKYLCFDDSLYHNFDYYFDADAEFVYSGDNADGIGIYKLANGKYGDDIVFVLNYGYLEPYRKCDAQNDGRWGRYGKADKGMYIYEYDESACYRVSKEVSDKTVSAIDAADYSRPYLTGPVYILSFYDENGLESRVTLYVGRNNISGCEISPELEKEILSFVSQDNVVDFFEVG